MAGSVDPHRLRASAQQAPTRAPAPSATEPPRAAVSLAGETSGLLALLALEEKARQAANVQELRYLIANETRHLTQARQIFVLDGRAAPRIEAASGVQTIDRFAPLVVGMESMLAAFASAGDGDASGDLRLDDIDHAEKELLSSYPFRYGLHIGFRSPAGDLIGGMLLVREAPFEAPAAAVATRLGGVYAHALALLNARPGVGKQLAGVVTHRRKVVGLAAAIALAALALPVSMTTLAPFEVAPRDPIIVAAPLEGVIEKVLVEPNQTVREGQPLLSFADTMLRNRLEVAEREVLVAEARVKKSTQLAFDDARGRQEVGIALAEHALKTAERNFARELLARAAVKADRAGIAICADKRTLAGKPVALGERIMQIADAQRVEIAIDVPVSDAIVLQAGARAKIFLDSDPLLPREAIVEHADYQARVKPGNALAYRVVASLADDKDLPRLGVRGVAQIYGEKVPLAFYLFRRPLTAARQWSGL